METYDIYFRDEQDSANKGFNLKDKEKAIRMAEDMLAEKKGYDGVFIGLPEWNEYAGDTYGYDIYIPVNMAVDKDNEAVKSFAGKLGDVTSDGVRPAYEAVYFIRGAIESGHLATAASIALKLPFLEGSTSLGDYSIGAYGNIDKAVDIVLMCDGEKSYMTTIFE